MKRKKIVKWLLLVLISLLTGFVGFSVFKLTTEELPTHEINLARESLARAKNNGAANYASDKLKDAEKFYQAAMQEWEFQNERFFWFRNFSKTRDLASKSLALSSDAKQLSILEKNKVGQQLKEAIKGAEKKIERFESAYKSLPLERATFDTYNQGKMEYLEAKNEISKNDFVKATVLIERANEKLLRADNLVRRKMEDFYKNYPDWIKNAQLAEQLSKKGQLVVLVNKMESKCSLLKSGKTIKIFNAEFGSNWMADKVMKGDRSTPEGVYKVTEKKKGIKTKYYKALLLNYPNNEDAARFETLKRRGSIPRTAQIGGLIEIHGDGGKGIHWTDGCIALKNSEMDQLYDLCSMGTPVIIIGSDKTLQDYLAE